MKNKKPAAFSRKGFKMFILLLFVVGISEIVLIKNCFAQLNYNAGRVSVDTIRARSSEQGGKDGVLHFPYNYSPEFSTIMVNDTLLHEWIFKNSAGGVFGGDGINVSGGNTVNLGGSYYRDILISDLWGNYNYEIIGNDILTEAHNLFNINLGSISRFKITDGYTDIRNQSNLFFGVLGNYTGNDSERFAFYDTATDSLLVTFKPQSALNYNEITVKNSEFGFYTRFVAAGSYPAGTTRSASKIIIGDPLNPNHAATKNYVDLNTPRYFTGNLSNTPSNLDIENLIGIAASFQAGYKAIINNSNNNNMFYVVSNGNNWFYVDMKQAF